MADFVEDEAMETEEEGEELDHTAKKRAKLSKAMEDSEEEEEDDDEDRIREELKDLIDDNPIDESEGEDSDGPGNSKKRRKSGSDDYDDQLEDDDYELLEENLGITVDRKKRFKRLRRMQDPESEDEDAQQPGEERDIIANQLFDDVSGDETERMSVRSQRHEEDTLDEARSESHYSDADDFIVDDDGRPIAEKRRNKRPVFSDATLQEAQDIFGIDFDYGEFDKQGDEDASQEEDEEEDDEYIEDDERSRRRKKAPKDKTKKNTIFDIYEPSELQRGHFTDKDNEIRCTDIPERMQHRSVPVTPVPEGSDELELESEWIYKQAFCRPTISIQDAHLSEEAKERARKGPQTVPKIKKALDFMRNQNFEVPFISFYRKEYVLPELNINDLWKVYKFDAKWCELRQRKENLVVLFERMRDYQLDEIMKNPDAPLPESMRVIKEEDIDRLKSVETSEELNDVYHHFMLYYSEEIPKMQNIIREKNREFRREDKIQKRQQRIYEAIEKGEEPPDDDADVEIEEENDEALKHAVKTGSYAICQKAGLHGLAKKFGLAPEHFAENVRDNYQRHDVDQDPIDPPIAAMQYCSPQFNTHHEVLKAAQQMVAIQLAREPLVRKCVREVYMERAKISVRPTKRGIKEIDENHPIYTLKYLKDKPVKELVGDQFLKLSIAERDKLITISLSTQIEGTMNENYVDELKQLYHRDEFSKNVQEWNALRAGSVEMAFSRMLIPDMQKELLANLMAESKEFVLRACCRKMYNWIKVAPYVYKVEDNVASVPASVPVIVPQPTTENWEAPEENWDDEEAAPPPPPPPTPPPPEPQPEAAEPQPKAEELDTSKGLRVMGIAYVPDFTQSAFACIIAPSGECTDYLRLPHFLKRKDSFKEDDKIMKEADLLAIRALISAKKPHVIALGGESREATMLAEDLRECITTLNTDEQYPMIQVEICENELAKIYAQSIKATAEYREYPVLLRQAISLARRLQDPLVEFSQLCTLDDEILCVKYHAYQDELPKEDLLENLQLEFVNRVNEVGVDINKALQEGYSGNLLQFVCGLGSRKAQALVKMLKQTNQRIENRTQLVTSCHMGPKVFINCAGFIKIDTASLGDSTEAYVEVLDGSRVHPETYEWARKMAVDALEYDDEDANPAGALEDIFKNPDRLKDLDLDAFAEELERQGFGNKAVTLYDIRAELNCRYKDLRAPYESPNPEKLFDMLTKETPETFYIGKLILATVTRIVYKKPEGEQLDQANPLRNDETGLWQCPFCMKNDFPELSEVWGHFDAGTCNGKAVGVRLRLDNGISGFIHIKNLSDKRVENPEERVRPGQIVHCRVIKIEVDRFSIECTSKSSDLADKNNEMRPQRDRCYDTEAEEKDIREEMEAKRIKQQRVYMKRVIVHPAFYNISYAEAAQLMTTMKQGDVIVRPSSKGADHLTVTWKVAGDILHHIDVREEGKKFGFSLGNKLWIGTEDYEDLDEIIARHVNPMAAYASELLECNYYKPNVEGLEIKAEEILKEKKKEKPSSIPCVLSPSKNYPAKFLLSYLPREHCQHEYITVTPDGVRYRGQVFPTIGKLFNWFKKHFREPRGIATPKTPSANTPGMYQGVRDEFTPHHTLSLVADESPNQYSLGTPSIQSAGGVGSAQSYPSTPYTPSAQTPFMTPSQTPGDQGQNTPSNNGFLRPNPPRNYRSNQSNFDSNKSDWGSDSSDAGRGRGRGRGRGNFRGRGTPSNRGSFSRNDSFNSSNNFSRNFNSSTPQKVGDNTPLWDESESWDSPPDKANQPGNSTLNVPKIGGQTPLWDESESWESPGEATLPNDPRASRASSSTCGSLDVPVIANRAPLWDASESWDSPPSESQQNASGSSQKNLGASSDPIIGVQAPLWNPDESWDSPPSGTQQKSGPPREQNRPDFRQPNTPTPATQTPLYDPSESWDSDEETTQNNSGASNPTIPSWQPNKSCDSFPQKTPGNNFSTPNRTTNNSRTSNFSRNERTPFSQQNRGPNSYNNSNSYNNNSNSYNNNSNSYNNNSNSYNSNSNSYNRNSNSYDSNSNSYSNTNSYNNSGRGNRGAARRGNNWNSSGRGNFRNNSSFNSESSSRPGNNAHSWKRNEGWNNSQANKGNWNQGNSGNKFSIAESLTVPITGTKAPLWDDSENWDAEELPQVRIASNDRNSQGNAVSQNKPASGIQPSTVPITAHQAPLWNDSESWDTEELPQVRIAGNDKSSQGDAASQNKPAFGNQPPIVPIKAHQAPLWNDSESWDTEELPQVRIASNDKSSQGNAASQNKPGFGNQPPTVPIKAPPAPLWNDSESWDTEELPQVRIASNDGNSQGNAASQNKPASRIQPPTIPIITPPAPLWNESESWDTEELPQVRIASNDKISQGNTASQNKPASGIQPPTIPIIAASAPLWNESESWDMEELPQVRIASNDGNSQGNTASQNEFAQPLAANKANKKFPEQGNSRNKPAANSGSSSFPVTVQNAPLWNESESWDTDDPVPGANTSNKEKGSEEKVAAQSEAASLPQSSAVPIVIHNVPLWNESESWDDPEPGSGTVSQSTAAPNVPYPSSGGNSSNYSNSSSSAENNRSAPWKPMQNWNSQGKSSENSRSEWQSERNSSFRRPRGNQHNNSGRWNQNKNENNWSSSGERSKNWNSAGNQRGSWNSSGNQRGNWNSSGNQRGNWNSSGNQRGNWNQSGNQRGNWNQSGNQRSNWNSSDSASPRNSGQRGRFNNGQPRGGARNDFGASSGTSGACNATLWKESESWDTPETATTRNDPPAGQNTSGDVSQNNSAPPIAPIVTVPVLWDESESWD